MREDRFKSIVSELGLRAEDYRALLFLPVVYVWWKVPRPDRGGFEQALERAKGSWVLRHSIRIKLLEWFECPPSDAFFRAAFKRLIELANAPEEVLIQPSDLTKLAHYCDAMARGAALSEQKLDAERSILRRLTQELEIKGGPAWSNVLHLLGAQPQFLVQGPRAVRGFAGHANRAASDQGAPRPQRVASS